MYQFELQYEASSLVWWAVSENVQSGKEYTV